MAIGSTEIRKEGITALQILTRFNDTILHNLTDNDRPGSTDKEFSDRNENCRDSTERGPLPCLSLLIANKVQEVIDLLRGHVRIELTHALNSGFICTISKCLIHINLNLMRLRIIESGLRDCIDPLSIHTVLNTLIRLLTCGSMNWNHRSHRQTYDQRGRNRTLH